MTVYLDLIILDNFAADFALLYLAVKTARGEVKLWRLALTALAGTALAVGYTVFTLYYTLPPAVEIFVKYGVAALLPVFASKYKKKSTLAIAVGAFLAYMFALAGLLTALFSDPQIEEGGGALTYTIGGVPSGVLVACTVLFVAAAKKTVAKIAKRKKILSSSSTVRFFIGKNRVRTRAFLDSGNMVTAPDGTVRGGGGKSARRQTVGGTPLYGIYERYQDTRGDGKRKKFHDRLQNRQNRDILRRDKEYNRRCDVGNQPRRSARGIRLDSAVRLCAGAKIKNRGGVRCLAR